MELILEAAPGGGLAVENRLLAALAAFTLGMSQSQTYITARVLIRIRASLELRHDKETHFSRYIDQVQPGAVVIVCRHNQPVAELRAIETPRGRPARVAGLLRGCVSWQPDAFVPMSDEELAEFDVLNPAILTGAAALPRTPPPSRL